MNPMQPGPHRHELSPAQNRAPLSTLLADLRPGQAVSVQQFPPFWDVCARRNGQGATEYIVTDSSVAKPQRVFGPVSQQEAVAWAQTTQRLWLTTHVSPGDL